jgi:hypothetical protein
MGLRSIACADADALPARSVTRSVIRSLMLYDSSIFLMAASVPQGPQRLPWCLCSALHTASLRTLKAGHAR